MIDFSEIRKEIAIEQNVLLGKEDPILMSVKINEIMFERYIQILVDKTTELNLEHRKAIDLALQKGIADARLVSSRQIAEGGKYLEEQAREGLMEATKDVIAKHIKSLNVALEKIEKARTTVVVATVVSLSCALVTVIIALNAGA